MNGKLIFAFGLGAAAGAVVTYFFMKRKKKDDFMWADDWEEETEESTTKESSEKVTCFDNKWKSDRPRTAYNDIYRKKYGTDDASPTEEDYPMYIITPEEYASREGYEAESLYYYKNGVLTDEDDNVIPNMEEMVGEDAVNHFGEYEEDVIHIRNDDLETDYEIQYVDEDFEPINTIRKEDL